MFIRTLTISYFIAFNICGWILCFRDFQFILKEKFTVNLKFTIQIGDISNEKASLSSSCNFLCLFSFRNVSLFMFESKLEAPFFHQTEPCCWPEPDMAKIVDKSNIDLSLSKPNSRASTKSKVGVDMWSKPFVLCLLNDIQIIS